jgi:hypothetical protein
MIRTALALLGLFLLLAACSSAAGEVAEPAPEPPTPTVELERYLRPPPSSPTTSTSTTTTSSTTTTAPPPPTAPPRARSGPCGGYDELIAAHFADPAKACSVMECETGGTFDPTIENPRSTASGLFQFLDSTWRSARELVGAGQYARAAHAPADVQIAAAGAWLRRTSWSQWVCA